MKNTKKALRTRVVKCLFLWITLSSSAVIGKTYDGVNLYRELGDIEYSWLTPFLPFNPIIVEAGAFRGAETRRAAKLWPEGHIFAFEPCPYSFHQLQKMVSEEKLDNVEVFNLAVNSYNGKATLFVCHGPYGTGPEYEYASSLLPLKLNMEQCCKGPAIKVPCVVLGDWCKENHIDHIDILKLEVEGLELQVLDSSPEILNATKIIWVKSMIHPYRVSMTEYVALKRYLEAANFVLVSHCYTPGIIGHALFISRDLFYAYF